jgi:O-antigen/teichoic acid export membrane protein
VAVNLVGEVVIKVAVGLVLVANSWGVAGVLAGFMAGATGSLLHSLWITRPADLWHGTGWFEYSIVHRTAPLFIGMVGTAMMLNLDLLGLKLFAPANQADTLVGYYQAAVILARTPVFIAQALTWVLFSYAAGEIKSGRQSSDNRKNDPYLQTALRMWARLLVPGGLVLILAPNACLSLFFPPTYQAAAPSLQMAAFGCILLALVTLLIGVFQAEGDSRRPAIGATAAVIAQIAVLAWLIPTFRALGAAFSLVIAGSMALLWLVPMLKAKIAFDATGWRDQILRVSLTYLCLIIPLVLLPDNNRTEAFIKLILSGVLYVGGLMIFILKPTQTNEAHARPHRLALIRFYQLIHILMGG